MVSFKRWVTYQLSYAISYNHTNKMYLHPLLYASFLDFRQNQSFSKKCFKCFKCRLHLWRTAQFTCTLNCWLAFSLFRCGFVEKIEPSWRDYFIWTADWGGVYNTADTKNTLIIFLSEIAVMWVIIWTKDNFYFISDCRNSLNCKLKKLISV